MKRWRARLVAVAALAAGAGAARADRTDQCIKESETGQRLLLTRHFVESRLHLVACGRAACPPAVISDCVDRLRQAEASMASVVATAQLADGAAAPDARVFVDDAPAAHRCTGEALWLDPGPHRFRFEIPDGAGGTREVIRSVTVEEGARLQRVTAGLEPGRVDATASPAVQPSARKPIAGIAGATGVVAIAAGAAFGLVAHSHQASEQRECASPTMCVDHAAAQRDYTTASRYGTASTIAFVAGGALVAAGVVLWLTASASAHPTTALGLAPAIAPDRAGLALQRAF